MDRGIQSGNQIHPNHSKNSSKVWILKLYQSKPSIDFSALNSKFIVNSLNPNKTELSIHQASVYMVLVFILVFALQFVINLDYCRFIFNLYHLLRVFLSWTIVDFFRSLHISFIKIGCQWFLVLSGVGNVGITT